ncbi:unnamed protein product, partial [Nesidiocoris tenuis]
PKKWMSSPSTLLEMSSIPDVGKYDLSSLKHVSVGGSPILPVQKKYLCDTLFKGRNIIQESDSASGCCGSVRNWKTSSDRLGASGSFRCEEGRLQHDRGCTCSVCECHQSKRFNSLENQHLPHRQTALRLPYRLCDCHSTGSRNLRGKNGKVRR